MMSSLDHACVRYCVCVSLDRQTEKAKAVQSSDSAQVWKMKRQPALALCLQAGSSRQWSNILGKVIPGYKLLCFILIAGGARFFNFIAGLKTREKFRWNLNKKIQNSLKKTLNPPLKTLSNVQFELFFCLLEYQLMYLKGKKKLPFKIISSDF